MNDIKQIQLNAGQTVLLRSLFTAQNAREIQSSQAMALRSQTNE